MVLSAWALLALALVRFDWRGRLGFALSVLAASGVAFATFLALNPFLWSHPRPKTPVRLPSWAGEDLGGRTREIIHHRIAASRNGQMRFPNDALYTIREKIQVVAVQGFGRFGPFGRSTADSRLRYDWAQDFGALIWGPWVAAGAAWALILGWRQCRSGIPPTALAVLVQAGVALFTVTAFVPLAWDRYFLSLQPGAALLASGLVTALFPRGPASNYPRES
jgi:hypothetical protein